MHEGHRGRLLKKVKDGTVLYEHELLEVLLFNACPRKNTNDVAHRLIDKFGSLAGVLAAGREELEGVAGVGRQISAYLSVLGKSLAACGNINCFAVLKSTADFKQFVAMRPSAEADVIEYCIIDRDGRVRRMVVCPSGENGRAAIDGHELMKTVSFTYAYGIFVCYRRVAGGTEPTLYDDETATSIAEICRVCGVRFYDYLITANGCEPFSYYVADRGVFGSFGGTFKNVGRG